MLKGEVYLFCNHTYIMVFIHENSGIAEFKFGCRLVTMQDDTIVAPTKFEKYFVMNCEHALLPLCMLNHLVCYVVNCHHSLQQEQRLPIISQNPGLLRVEYHARCSYLQFLNHLRGVRIFTNLE